MEQINIREIFLNGGISASTACKQQIQSWSPGKFVATGNGFDSSHPTQDHRRGRWGPLDPHWQWWVTLPWNEFKGALAMWPWQEQVPLVVEGHFALGYSLCMVYFTCFFNPCPQHVYGQHNTLLCWQELTNFMETFPPHPETKNWHSNRPCPTCSPRNSPYGHCRALRSEVGKWVLGREWWVLVSSFRIEDYNAQMARL